jgi:DNA-binding beta-propeller fold protein YncE
MHVQRAGSIAVADPGHLADCTYDNGTLYVGNNLFGLSTVSRVVDGKVVPIASIGVGFPEVLAVRGDVFYRMSDTGGAPSLMSKFRCSPTAR